MVWSEILIILTSAIGATYIFWALKSSQRDVKILCLFTLFSIISFQINKFLVYENSWIVSEVLKLLNFSVILSILLLTVRKLKPEFARYPYAIAFFPILIPVLYPLIAGNETIIQLVVQLLQIAALLSLLSILVSHIENKRVLALSASAAILFISAMVLYWFGETIKIGFWLWQTLAAIAIPLISYSLTKFYNNNSIINRYEF